MALQRFICAFLLYCYYFYLGATLIKCSYLISFAKFIGYHIFIIFSVNNKMHF